MARKLQRGGNDKKENDVGAFAAGVQSFTSARRPLAQRVKVQNDPRAAPSIVTQPSSPGALSTDFTLRRLLDAAGLPGRTQWPQLHRVFFPPREEKIGEKATRWNWEP